jgi:uncharacterized protein YggE
VTSSESKDAVVTVTGSGSAEAEPDRVRLHLRVQAQESSAKAATDAFAVTLAGARALLDELGCTYTVGSLTSWEGGKERRTRHQVGCDVMVTVDDLSVLPRLVERALETDRLGVSQLQWQLSTVRELRRQARVKAIADAREAAQDYAEALGLRLGQVLSVSDPESGGLRPMMGRAAGMLSRSKGGAERPEIDLSATEPVRVEGTVTLSFLLEGAG